jgi:hypothetical protein
VVVPILLAHGALGPFDELLFILVGLVFVGLMVTAWIRSRNSAPDQDEATPSADSTPATPADTSSNARPDHFPLA